MCILKSLFHSGLYCKLNFGFFGYLFWFSFDILWFLCNFFRVMEVQRKKLKKYLMESSADCFKFSCLMLEEKVF